MKFSAFRDGFDEECDLAEFLIFALWEWNELRFSDIYAMIPRVEKGKIIKVFRDLRDEHNLIERRPDSHFGLTRDGEIVRKAKGTPSWYYATDHPHMWHPQVMSLGLNLVDHFSPLEVRIIERFTGPFATSEASDFIGFSAYSILCGLENSSWLKRSAITEPGCSSSMPPGTEIPSKPR